MQKARRHTLCVLRPLVGARVQDLFHSPARGSFHLSFTVLVRYRSLGSIEPYRMVPADSRRIPRVPRYSGYRYVNSCFAYGIITLYDASFQMLPLAIAVRQRGPTTPTLRCHNIGLGSSPFARHY